MSSPITSSDFENQTPGQALCDAFQEKLLNNSKMRALLDYFFTDPDGKLNVGFIGDLLTFITPIGTVVWHPKTLTDPTPDDGAQWLEANNQRLLQTDYARLFAIYGLAYKQVGDNDATDFRVPDLQGKFLLGRSSGHAYGTTGGEESHVLTVDEIAPHQHLEFSSDQVNRIAGGGASDLDASKYPASANNQGGNGDNSYVMGKSNDTKASIGLTSVAGGVVNTDADASAFSFYADKYKAAAHNTMPPYFTGVYYVLAGYKVAGVMV